MLPPAALGRLGDGPFGVYVHVPFCTVRCGYCDFNTYTLTELGDGSVPGASLGTYASPVLRELDLARRVLGDRPPAVETGFVGGGTPTLLAATDPPVGLRGIGDPFGLAPRAQGA